MPVDDHERISPRDREEWRAWLADHHAEAMGVWVTIAKKGADVGGPSYDEAVEEALAFGWIDSLTRRLDGSRFVQLFTPRKPKSNWSSSNKGRIERLTAEGRMAPAGLRAVEEAKRNGSWQSSVG